MNATSTFTDAPDRDADCFRSGACRALVFEVESVNAANRKASDGSPTATTAGEISKWDRSNGEGAEKGGVAEVANRKGNQGLSKQSLFESWLPDMDLNHDKQIQNLLCYRYTIGQSIGRRR